ncbi:MAG: hypothetical protein K6G28_02670 [Acholeplasmatales bacterium]|nr:hypothetical protein [Acholeplasmatales bacterium]
MGYTKKILRRICVPIIVFIVTLTASLIAFNKVRNMNRTDNIAKAYASTCTKANRIEQELNWYYNMASTDVEFYEKNSDEIKENFEIFSQLHKQHNNAIRTFAIFNNNDLVCGYNAGVSSEIFKDFLNNIYTKNELSYLQSNDSIHSLISNVYNINNEQIFYTVFEL